MKIGILGAGNVGATLGRKWAASGHDVRMGVRSPGDGEVSMGEAFNHGEVLLLATPWGPAEGFLKGLGDFGGKILIDATNPIAPDLSGLTHGTTTSGAEQVAAWARGSRVVKCFNTVGFNVMENTSFAEGKPSMLYCGDGAEAKHVAGQLAAECGFEPLDAGPLMQARWLEPLAMLWITMAIKHGYGREMAFRLMRR
ncbi:MAG: NADPH-dependent F420 reductase [Bryobacteraceae bacterium]|nr:NADPH-dependent F420 reductase [Bryobacteraceae bacterium]